MIIAYDFDGTIVENKFPAIGNPRKGCRYATVIDDLIASSPDNVNAYKAGKVQLFGWFVGQTLKAMKGQANPQIVNEILKKKLG